MKKTYLVTFGPITIAKEMTLDEFCFLNEIRDDLNNQAEQDGKQQTSLNIK